jgi:hypothetical protein
MTDKQQPAEPSAVVKAPNTNTKWGTVADQLDETMRQRLLDFGKEIV